MMITQLDQDVLALIIKDYNLLIQPYHFEKSKLRVLLNDIFNFFYELCIYKTKRRKLNDALLNSNFFNDYYLVFADKHFYDVIFDLITEMKRLDNFINSTS